MISLMDIQILFWFCRYLNVLIRSISSDGYQNRRFITIDTYTLLAQGSSRPRSAEPTRGVLGLGTQVVHAFVPVGCPCTVPASQSGLAAAPANGSLKKGNGAAQGLRLQRCQRDEVPHHNVMPVSTWRKTP